MALMLVSTQAFGYNFFSDDVEIFDHNNNWSPINYPNGIGHRPSPGTNQNWEGGENFDLEGLLVREDSDNIYIGLTNSFGYTTHSSAYNWDYDLGDLFIGVDGAEYSHALDLNPIGNNANLFTYGIAAGINDDPGTYYGTWVADAVGDYMLFDGQFLTEIETYCHDLGDFETDPIWDFNQQTYFWEFCIDKSYFGDFNTLDFHITLGCGNDLIEETYTKQVVPEPATLILLGIGVLGTTIVRRRKR